MPQSWDMRQIILLPLWRKACCGFFRRLRSGANPRSWVPEGSMLTTRPPKPLVIRVILVASKVFTHNCDTGKLSALIRVRILLEAWKCVSCDCCVFLCIGVCDGPIPRPEESYRVWSAVTIIFYTYSGQVEEARLRKKWIRDNERKPQTAFEDRGIISYTFRYKHSFGEKKNISLDIFSHPVFVKRVSVATKGEGEGHPRTVHEDPEGE
jgi:hypothetical protein